MKNKICVYAICKNEAKYVEEWYESMKEADAIVVLDTGSTDNTVELLKAKGVKVEVKEIKPWRFDVARNESLKLCPEDCNILISTDFDEKFEKGWAKLLRDNWVEGKHTRCKYNYVWSHLSNGQPGLSFWNNKCHARGWEWNYPVHEILFDFKRNQGTYTHEEELDLFDKLTLHHYQDMNKVRTNYLPLLELREKENPTNDSLGAMELAHGYYYENQFENAVKKSKEVLERYKDELTITEKANLYRTIGICSIKLNRRQEALKAFSNGIASDATYMDNYVGIAEAYIDLFDYKNAVKALKAGLKYAKQKYLWFEDQYSFSYKPYYLLSKAYLGNGNKLEALGCAVKAFSFNPNDETLVNNVYEIINKTKPTDY